MPGKNAHGAPNLNVFALRCGRRRANLRRAENPSRAFGGFYCSVIMSASLPFCMAIMPVRAISTTP